MANPDFSSHSARRPRNRWLWVALAAAIVLGFCAGAGWIVHGYFEQKKRAIESVRRHQAEAQELMRAARDQLPASVQALLRAAGFTPADRLQAARPLDFYDTRGVRRSLGQFQGKLVLLNFWGTTCIPCLQEFPELEQLEEEYRERGLAVLCVCVDEQDTAKVRRVAEKYAKRLPVYADTTGSAHFRYDVQVMPTAYLIDREGNQLGSARGVLKWSSPAAKELLEKCLDPPGKEQP